MTLAKLKLLLLPIIAVFILSACGGGETTSSGEQTTTQETNFSEIKNVESVEKLSTSLKALNINTTQELASELEKNDPLEVFIKLKEQDDSLKSEDMLNMMKDLEKEIVLKPLLDDKKISDKAFKSLETINKSVTELKETTLRQINTFDKNEVIPEEVNEEYIKQQLIAYNNEIGAYGEEPLTLEEFKSLRNAVDKIEPVFSMIRTSLQNVEAQTTTTKKARYFSKAVIDNSKRKILNEVDENIGAIKKAPTAYLNYKPNIYQSCKVTKQTYPLQLMGKKEKISEETFEIIAYEDIEMNPSFLKDVDDKRSFQLNKKGLAQIEVRNKSNEVYTFEIDHYDNTIVSVEIPALQSKKIYLPIFQEDVCVPYLVDKDDENIELFVNDIKESKKMQRVVNEQNGSYNFEVTHTTNDNLDYFPEAKLYEFSLSKRDDLNSFVSQIDIINANEVAREIVLLKSPSGKFYQSINTMQSVPRETGKWQLLVFASHTLIADEFSFINEDKRISHIPVVNKFNDNTQNNSYKLSIHTGERSQRKKFIVAEMKNAEFSKDGEDDGNPGEVSLSLHTNMAPKLELGADINAQFGDKKSYKAYECWVDNTKDAKAFNENQACSDQKESLEQLLYEFFTKEFQSNNFDNIQIKALLSANYNNLNLRQNILFWYDREFKNRLNDYNFNLLFNTYKNIYDNWQNNVVQINDMQYPFGANYQIKDSFVSTKNNNQGALIRVVDDYMNPIIPTNIPILALSKDRMAKSTLPIAFQYSALEDDEVSKGLQIWAVTKYVLNQALAVATGNFAGLVCNTVNTMKELRKIERDGDDDPIGEADFFLNRYSTADQFYGLQNSNLDFSISGNATIPNNYTSFDKGLDKASIGCSIYGAVTTGVSLYNSVDNLINGDANFLNALNEQKDNLIAQHGANSEQVVNFTNAMNDIINQRANAETFNDLYKILNMTSTYSNGVDIYDRIEEIKDKIGGLGSQGHNTMRSEANYYFSSFDQRKTRSNITVKEVDGLPVLKTKVTLTKVHIYNNKEDGNAEVQLKTRVGVISDSNPTYSDELSSTAPYKLNGELVMDNGSKGYKTLPNLPFKGYILRSKYFKKVKDNQLLNLGTGLNMYEATYPAENKSAAFYIEIGLHENDGDTVDDDMIGVFSKTFYLEDLYNYNANFKWSHSGNTHTLSVSDFPIYDANNLQTSVELIDQERRTKQLEHNEHVLSYPSATISFTVEIEEGDYSDNIPTEISDDLIPIEEGSFEDYEKDNINLQEVSSLITSQNSKSKVFDIFKNNLLVHDGDSTLKIVSYNEHKKLQLEKTINSNELNGDYKYLLKDRKLPYMNTLRNINFIDENHILVFYSQIDATASTTMAVIDLRTNTIVNNQSIAANTNHLTVQRINEHLLRVFSIIPSSTANSGIIETYEVNANSIQKLATKNINSIPYELLVLDNDNLLLKSYNIVKKSADTWAHKKRFYTFYKLEDNQLIETQLYQDNLNISDTNMSIDYIQSSDKRAMYNINHSNFNRIISHEKWSNKNYFKKLIYNYESKQYRFTQEQPYSTYMQDYLIQNEKYGFTVKKNLEPYDSKATRLRFNAKATEITSSFDSINKLTFLDERYLLIEGSRNNGNNGIKILDTQYALPILDFDKKGLQEVKKNTHLNLRSVLTNNPNDETLSYKWYYKKSNEYEKQEAGNEDTFSHSFSINGDYIVFLEATTLAGEVLKKQIEVKVISTPDINTLPEVTLTPLSKEINLGQGVSFTATATDEDDDILKYEWSVQKDNGTPVVSIGSNTFYKQFSQTGDYKVTLKVIDTQGAYTAKTANILVTKASSVDYTLTERNATVKNKEVVHINVGYSGNAINIYEQPKHGEIELYSIGGEEGAFKYTSTDCFEGEDTFSYAYNNEYGLVKVDVQSYIEDFTVKNINKKVYANESISGEIDTTSNVRIIRQAQNGVATVTNRPRQNALFEYTPNKKFEGNDYIVFAVTKTHGTCSKEVTARINFEVKENSAPSVNLTPADKTISLFQSITFNVVASDMEDEESLLRYKWSINKNNEGAQALKNLSSTYTKKFNEEGIYDISVEVTDTKNETTKKTTRITVEKSPVSYTLIERVANIKNKEETHIIVGYHGDDINIYEQPKHGQIELYSIGGEEGAFKYTSTDCFEGQDTFSYEFNNEYGLVKVNIQSPINDFTLENIQREIVNTTTLQEEVNTLGDISLSTNAQNGKVDLINISGRKPVFIYTPSSNFIGDDYFEYTITKEQDGCSKQVSARVDITVTGIPQKKTKLIAMCQDPYNIGKELYKTDGTKDGTSLVKNINWSKNNSNIYIPENTKLGDTQYFVERNSGYKAEPWSTQGSDADTQVHEINTNNSFNAANLYGNSNPSNFVKFDNHIFFTASNNGFADYGLYIIDENKNFTRIANTVGFRYKVLNNKLNFMYENGNNIQIQKVNSSLDGIETIHTFTNHDTGSLADYSNTFTNIDDKLIFSLRDENPSSPLTGLSLYSLVEGNEPIRLSTIYQVNNYAQDLVKANNKVYVISDKTGDNSTQAREILETDGTKDGTRSILTMSDKFRINNLVSANNKLYFRAVENVEASSYDKHHLYEYDLENSLLNVIYSFQTIGAQDSISEITTFENKILFTKRVTIDGKLEEKQFVSDGTSANTIMYLDNKNQEDLKAPYILNNKYFFENTMGELYETDFTLEGTEKVIPNTCDIYPDSFSFIDVNSSELDTLHEDSITVEGINYPETKVSISGNGEYSLDNKLSWTSEESTVGNGQEIWVRLRSSNSYNTTVSTTLNVGERSDTFSIKTKTEALDIPDKFTFTDVSDVELNSVQTASVTITGINVPVNLTINDGDSQYSLDNGITWSNSNTTVENNQTILVKHTSASSYKGSATTTLKVGGVSDIFDSTTKAEVQNIENVVTKGNLMWEDTSHVKTEIPTWFMANAYCQDLELGGFTDWKIPSLEEGNTIQVAGLTINYEPYTQENQYDEPYPDSITIADDFESIIQSEEIAIWTTTNNIDETGAPIPHAYKLTAFYGKKDNFDIRAQDDGGYVRCVRDIE